MTRAMFLQSIPIVTAACLFASLPPARAADDAKGDDAKSATAAVSDTTVAERECFVRAVESDTREAWQRLRRPEIIGPIGQETLGLPPEKAGLAITRQQIAGGTGVSHFTFQVALDPGRLPQARPAAKEFADRLIARFAEALADVRRERTAALAALAKQRLGKTRDEYEAVSREQRERQQVMGGQLPEGARAALGRLQDEKERIELDLAGMVARQKAVEEWIDRTSRQLQEQAKTDPVIAELEKAVSIQQDVLDRVRKLNQSGQASATDVSLAEAKLSEVKVQLLDRKRGSAGADAGAAGTDPLAALNQELQKISIDIVDRKARLAFVEKRLATTQEALAGASDYDLLESEKAALRKELEQARQDLRAAERTAENVAQQQPEGWVDVVQANDGKYGGQ